MADNNRKKSRKKVECLPLQALTAAALMLPGLLTSGAHAADGDEVDFQYSHFQEGKRDISVAYDDPAIGSSTKGAKSFNPIEADSLRGSSKISLTDRIKFAFNYTQDTWGGATPTNTAPAVAGGNRALFANGDTAGVLAGASPEASGAGFLPLYLDAQLNPLFKTQDIDPLTGAPVFVKNTRLSHTMATASPETRKQGDFKLSYDWDNAAASVGGGISIEDDYESRFGNIGGRFDFNQKRTTVNIDLSYTNSETNATLDHDDYTSKRLIPENQKKIQDGRFIVHGNRQDWAPHLGLTQVLNKDALLSADVSYTRSTGYLSNPYKGVAIAFIDPDPIIQFDAPPGGFVANLNSYYEQRPEVKNQWSMGGHYVQFINLLNAALHFDYRFSADDWGTQMHTFEADWVQPLGNGWSVTPRIRYYSQDAANFYAPYLVTNQGQTSSIIDPVRGRAYINWNDTSGALYFDNATLPIPTDTQGNPVFNPFTGNAVVDAQGNVVTDPAIANNVAPATQSFDRNKLPAYFSSDQRLSGFGTLSGGVTVTKQFAKGVSIETGFEYYTHQGSLKIGGDGEGAYTNFDYWVANAALKVNLEALALRVGSRGYTHDDHQQHSHGHHAPAGVMFDHMLPKAGDFMAGYRYMYSSQNGHILHESNPVSDQMIVRDGCNDGAGCFLTPDSMVMHMHMLDLMYAPTDWLTLMLMPQFVDMSMSMRKLDGAPAVDLGHGLGGHLVHHIQNGHDTGGIGDLGMYALFKVFDNGTHHIHATLGLSAPTGDVDIQLKRNHQLDGGYIHYGMQLGSGTWDFKPSVTYTGQLEQWSWGAQANGTVRMENQNESGYALGDIFQATAWGGYNLSHWLTASVRGVYTVQGGIKSAFTGSSGGQFVDHNTPPDVNGTSYPVYSSILKYGPMDYPSNYGGQYWDAGFGLSAFIPSGDLAGNRVSVEWLQPVSDDVNGYQLKRDGALSATWSYHF